MFKNYSKTIFLAFLSIISTAILSQTNFAQSTDPDKPTALTNGIITGESTSNLQDDKTYYFSFNVKPGTLTMTVDMNPDKATGGGTLAWHYLDAKFKQLKYDIYSASGATERKVVDSKVTIKRKIILKIVTGGKFSYKIKFSGTALN